MEDFDEFGVYSLPSDPPTRADDIAIVREAAARDPKVREFLQRIRSRTESVAVRARIQEALAEGHPGIGAFKDLVAAKQENEEARKRAEESTAAVEQMSQQVSELSIQRDNLLRRIEDLNHSLLLTTSVTKHHAYQTARAEKYKHALEKLYTSKPATMQEAEQMLNAVQYDIQAGKVVNLDRIMEHRQSILSAIIERTKRDGVALNALVIPDKAEGQAHLDDIIARTKQKVLQNAKLVEQHKRAIADLQSRVGVPTEAAKVHALKKVHTRLLQIVDELVPESGSEDMDIIIEDDGSVESIMAEIHEEMRLARECILAYNGEVVRPQVSESVVCTELDKNLKTLKELEAQGRSIPEAWKSFSARPVTEASNATDSITGKAQEIADLEIKMKNDQMRSQVSNLHSLKATSSNLLFQEFSKASLESPLLADKNLYSVKTLQELSSVWRDESLERQAASDAEYAQRAQQIEQQLEHIQARMHIGQSLLDDVNSLPDAP